MIHDIRLLLSQITELTMMTLLPGGPMAHGIFTHGIFDTLVSILQSDTQQCEKKLVPYTY